MSASILSLDKLRVSYGQIPAIRDVTLEVSSGEIVALIGSNGAGKTTILRTISGLLKPISGRILFEEGEIANAKPHRIVRMGISHAPERRGIFANLTVLENLKMGAFNRRLYQHDYDEVYALFPRLSERTKQIAGTLSGGEQQMLAMGRALLARPKLLLLDEPSLGLAPQVTKTIFDTIVRINSGGTTVLLVEQNANAALKIAHRGYVLEVGEIVFQGNSRDLLANDQVRKAYLGDY